MNFRVGNRRGQPRRAPPCRLAAAPAPRAVHHRRGGVRARDLPEPAGDVDVDELYGVPRAPPAGDRPWVGVCMIASLDGATVVDGRSGGLGNPTDRAVLGAPAAGRRRRPRRRRHGARRGLRPAAASRASASAS